jgi:single-strand DNA-binding protein
MNVNKIIISGRLVKDPESKNIGETDLCNFRIASNRTVGKKKVEKSIFIDVDVWAGQAKVCQKFLKKGSKVIVDGTLSQDTWKNKEGENSSKIYIEADNVIFLDSNNNQEETTVKTEVKKTNEDTSSSKINNDKKPYNQNTDNNIKDDDLPF